MIFPIITILALAGIFIVLMRRFPQADGVAPKPFKWPRFQLRGFQLNQLNLSRFKLPKLPNLPQFKRKLKNKPEVYDPFAPVAFNDILIKADTAFEGKDYRLAEKLYLDAATHDPENPKIYGRLGVMYLNQGNFRDARDAFLFALKYDERVASRHYNLALAYQALGTTNKALAEIKRALDLDPGNEKYASLRQNLEG